MLEKIDSFSESTHTKVELLDLTKLTEFQEVECVAYVQNGYSGVTKFQKGYATFILKDCNANVVRATLFDVENFMRSGLDIAMFKRKPVLIHAAVQNFNNSMSLVLSETHPVVLYTGEFDYSKFIGKLHFNKDYIEDVGRRIFGTDYNFPTKMQTVSLDNVGQGRVGAFGKVFEMVMTSLLTMQDVPGVEFEELMWVFFHAMDNYLDAVTAEQKVDILDGLNSYSVIEKVNLLYKNDDHRLLMVDTIRALMGFANPSHLIAHLIFKSYKNAVQALELSLTNSNLPLMAKTKVGGDDLLKY